MVMMVMMVMMTMVAMRTEVERRWRAVIQAWAWLDPASTGRYQPGGAYAAVLPFVDPGVRQDMPWHPGFSLFPTLMPPQATIAAVQHQPFPLQCSLPASLHDPPHVQVLTEGRPSSSEDLGLAGSSVPGPEKSWGGTPG